MRTKYPIFLLISVTVFFMGMVVYPVFQTAGFEGYSSLGIQTALANTAQAASEDSDLRFIDFQYAHAIGEPIKFIVEIPRDSNCNSYDAKITDEDGNFIVGWSKEIFCNPTLFSNSISHQTEIGHNEDTPHYH